MRYLAAKGWLNFSARAMVISVGCAQLDIDWQRTGQFFARHFVDYDTLGRFTHRYILELTHVPDDFLQEPWK